MIAATFDPAALPPDPVRFRGEDLLFWEALRFRGIKFYPPDQLKQDYDQLVIFDFSKFLEIEPAGISELKRQIRSLKDSLDIVTLAGFPLFILSRKKIRKQRIRINKDFCSELTRNRNIRTISLKQNHHTLELSGDPGRIETCIIRFQTGQLLKQGVYIDDYRNFYLDASVAIGRGSRIGPGSVVRGNSRLGRNVRLYSNCYIENCNIGADCSVLPHSVLRDSVLEDGVQVGPFVHMRNHAVIKRGGKAGNFVEMKKTTLGRDSKAMHLSYLGDAKIGEQVNIGAGTITCNYDGQQKHTTIIEDKVFVGSGTELVAPVKVGKNSLIAAGSTITEDVPPDSLAIARELQSNKKGWVRKQRKKSRKPK